MQQHEVYERARLARDPRFDGRFFVGVRTTGIYCRPICPAVAPKRKNVVFYPSAAAASEAGFRPCLRCRPECAPGTPAWNGTSTTVRRGLRLIAGGALDGGSIEELADRLGVTSRHLRRLFIKHVGASPLAVAHTQRLHFAKRLIDETNLPMSSVADAAGFHSIRRFNDAFRKTYGRSPRDLRGTCDTTLQRRSGALSVRLSYRKPFDSHGMLAFLAGRATPGIEQVIGNRYLRTVVVNDQPGTIDCEFNEHNDSLTLALHGIRIDALFPLVQRVRELFDLDAPIDDIADTLGSDLRLGELLENKPGIRVPGAWDGFELTVRAILGQQVSVKAATTLARRIVDRYGERFVMPESLSAEANRIQLTRLFPAPARLARARFDAIGVPGARIDTIRNIASAVARGELDFDSAQDPDEFCAKLTKMRGIGDWTAQYVAMRVLKNPDAFPVTDLGVSKALSGQGKKKTSVAALNRRAEAWRPWRAYATLLLWGSLANAGG